jgi:hypothetical protein
MKPVIPFLFHLFTSFRPEQALAHQRSANGREKTLSIFYFFLKRITFSSTYFIWEVLLLELTEIQDERVLQTITAL